MDGIMNALLPDEKGTYILILSLRGPKRLTIGRLGTFDFPAGYYAYVGSAYGRGGLRGRLKHHFAPVTKLHWHIDYLRQVASLCEVWHSADETIHEHHWAKILRLMPDAATPVSQFGASDCNCETHLMYFPEKPEMARFYVLAGASIKRWCMDS